MLSPLGRTHNRAPSSTSTAEIVESSPCCCQCQCPCQQPSTSATLRSNASDSFSGSSYSCNTLGHSRRNCCHSCDNNLNAYSNINISESFSFIPATPSTIRTTTDGGTYLSEDEDSVLRYSFKGIPPETYSAKKEFIYRRPLVEKQVREYQIYPHIQYNKGIPNEHSA